MLHIVGLSKEPCFWTGKRDSKKVVLCKFEEWGDEARPLHISEVLKQLQRRETENAVQRTRDSKTARRQREPDSATS